MARLRLIVFLQVCRRRYHNGTLLFWPLELEDPSTLVGASLLQVFL